MKHEALTEAITMIDDKFIAEAQEITPRKAAYLPKIFTFAGAAAAAVIAAVMLLPKSGGEILVYGSRLDAPAAITPDSGGIARASVFMQAEIPLEIKAEKAAVTVSDGEIFLADSADVPLELPAEISGDTQLVWIVPLDSNGNAPTLTVASDKETSTFNVSFDEETGVWFIGKEKIDN